MSKKESSYDLGLSPDEPADPRIEVIVDNPIKKVHSFTNS